MSIRPRTIFTGDNLPVLRGMENQSVDLIYLDPPFNKKKTFAAPIGSRAAGAAFKDTWTLDDVDEAWHAEIEAKSQPLFAVIEAAGRACDKGMKSYLIMMSMRLLEMKRILKSSGTIYLHCDPTASHYLKLLMDAVFGYKNFRNEIVWCYFGGGRARSDFAKKHDIIFRYAAGAKFTFEADAVRMPYKAEGLGRKDDSMWGRHAGIDKIYKPNRLGKVPEDWWEMHQLNANSPERTGYPTQKPLALLKRIILASSKVDDIVLDPFCGCATTLVAAEELSRRWIGVDISEKANELVRMRLKSLGLFNLTVIHRTDIPKRKGHRSKSIKTVLYGRQSGDCNLCKVHFFQVNFSLDHIVPLSHGGLDDDDNLQLLCARCNSIKGDGTMQQAKARYLRLQKKGGIT
ncbi:MAG: DNA methyltransferase [Gammaproteobacteria bacterium]